MFVHEHMCLCVVLSMGIESRFSATVAYGVHPGDEPVSSTGLFCAHMCGFMGVICVCACVCMCVLRARFFHSDDHLCPALQSSPFCPAP